MTHILHIDTSGGTGLVMIARDGQPVKILYNQTERDHAGSINTMIGTVLAETGLSLTDINAIAICSGPGSYTGLRIGMATAKGLAYALNLPIIAHNKLELLTDLREIDEPKQYMVVLPARDGEYFVLSRADELTPVHMTTEDVNKLILTTDDINLFGYVGTDIKLSTATDYIANDAVIPDLWAILGFNDYLRNKFKNIASLEPMYIKEVFIHKKHGF